MTDKLPQESIGDELHRGARMALSLIPGVGGVAVEVFSRLLAPPIWRRQAEWLNGLADRIDKLEQEGRFKVEDLKHNDEFISTVMQASHVAIRNHQQEKIDALRNAVLNTALGQAPDDSKREMFLDYVDTLTVIHLRVLATIKGLPVDREEAPPLSVGELVEHAAHALGDVPGQRTFVEVIVTDLCSRGLVLSINLWTAPQKPDSHLTELGREFLSFISEPERGRS